MPFQLVRNDITKMDVTAIVNAANPTLLGGGGVDGAIHRAAGPQLLEECAKLGGCNVGDAKITGAYRLPCRYVIHTVGPIWSGGNQGEKALLESCYRNSLQLAAEHQCESVAFPLISSGVYGYPKDQALKVAMDVISSFLLEHDMMVYLVIFDKAAFHISEKLFSDIAEYIDDHYVDTHFESRSERLRANALSFSAAHSVMAPRPLDNEECTSLKDTAPLAPKAAAPAFATDSSDDSLEDILGKLDESFSEMLLRKIDEKGMTDAACYKKANIDRKLFSKIRSDKHYRPSKPTAIAFAISLELSLAETKDLLEKAGFALSHSNKFDIIVEYFIRHGNYDIYAINEALFAFDQSLLGA